MPVLPVSQYSPMKRIVDVVGAMTAIVLFSPVILIISIVLHVQHGKPVFFSQLRPGLNSVPFRLIKFRTMTNDRDQFGCLLPSEQRLTKLGLMLRSTSLDELPELWNVLKGDMSLVGPRPLLMEYLPYYSPEQLKRHEVRPGLTGWAQVNGRNELGWEEKFKLDVWYVNNMGFMLDVKILLLTMIQVLQRKDVAPKDREISKRFDTIQKEKYGK